MAEEQEKKKNWFMRHKVATTLVVLFVIAGISSDSQKKKVETVPAAPIQEVKEEPFKYQIVWKLDEGAILNITVYTEEKEDQRIIQLTDKIISENKNKSFIGIRYFDDKKIASEFNAKVFNEDISDEVFSHYIADFKYNAADGARKSLDKNKNGNWVELKKY